MEVGADGDRSAKATVGQCGTQPVGQRRRWTEEPFRAGHVEHAGAGCAATGVFNARGEIGGAFKQHGARRGLAFKGAPEQTQTGQTFGLHAGHAQRGAHQPGIPGEGADRLKRRAALQHGHGLGLQIGVQAQQGLGGKLRSVNTGIEFGIHALFSSRASRNGSPQPEALARAVRGLLAPMRQLTTRRRRATCAGWRRRARNAAGRGELHR